MEFIKCLQLRDLFLIVEQHNKIWRAMETEKNHEGLSPTVLRVIERFVAAMRADEAIQDDAIDRLENLLRKGTVPKPDEIKRALLKSPQDDQT